MEIVSVCDSTMDAAAGHEYVSIWTVRIIV
jgi:hypothetical protein